MNDIGYTLFGCVIGIVLGFIFDRKIVKYQEYRLTAKEVRDIFIEIKDKIENIEVSNNSSISSYLKEELKKTDVMVAKLLTICDCIKKRQISKLYKRFRIPHEKLLSKGITKYSLNIYDFNKNDYQVAFPKSKLKKGKELALKNLDKLIKKIK